MRGYALHSLDGRNRNIECPGYAGPVYPSGGPDCPSSSGVLAQILFDTRRPSWTLNGLR
jgi:hypothetical protein